jgi:hypothetical protein
MKIISTLTLIFIFTLTLSAQSKKEVVEKGIKVKQNFELDIAAGDKEPFLEKEEVYNFRGDIVEIKEFKEKGKALTLWFKYKYDAQGNMIEETELTAKGEVKVRYEYKFENGLKTEKLYYDNKNRLYKKKIYKYELRK